MPETRPDFSDHSDFFNKAISALENTQCEFFDRDRRLLLQLTSLLRQVDEGEVDRAEGRARARALIEDHATDPTDQYWDWILDEFHPLRSV